MERILFPLALVPPPPRPFSLLETKGEGTRGYLVELM